MSSVTFPEGAQAYETLLRLFSRLRELRIFKFTLKADKNTSYHLPEKFLSQIPRILEHCLNLESFSFVTPKKCDPHESPSVNFEEIFGPASTVPQDMKLASLELRGVTVAASKFRQHIRHFRHLTKLHITFDHRSSAATNIGEILHLLAEDRIYLKDISVDAIHHPGVFDYLTSYSGIERLSLRPLHAEDDSPELLRRFFLSVLPTHSNSLRWLYIRGNLETEWSKALPRMYLREIEKCQLLEYICCWIIVPPEDQARSEALVSDALTIIGDFFFS
jgi:hypothetical protein